MKHLKTYRLYEGTTELSFDSLMSRAPKNLIDYIETLKRVEQRPDAHPEGDVYIHTKTVVDRLAKHNDINLSLAGIFHDTGKDRTTEINPKTGYPMQPNHEKYSAQAVKIFASWIKKMGGNANMVHDIVENHMKLKFSNQLSRKYREHLESLPFYDLLVKFDAADQGGTASVNESEGAKFDKYWELIDKYASRLTDDDRKVLRGWIVNLKKPKYSTRNRAGELNVYNRDQATKRMVSSDNIRQISADFIRELSGDGLTIYRWVMFHDADRRRPRSFSLDINLEYGGIARRRVTEVVTPDNVIAVPGLAFPGWDLDVAEGYKNEYEIVL